MNPLHSLARNLFRTYTGVLEWFSRGRSVRTQLIFWNIVALTLLLGLLGVVIRYTVQSFLLSSVDRELTARTQRLEDHPPPQFRNEPNRGPGFQPTSHPGLESRLDDDRLPGGLGMDGMEPQNRDAIGKSDGPDGINRSDHEERNPDRIDPRGGRGHDIPPEDEHGPGFPPGGPDRKGPPPPPIDNPLLRPQMFDSSGHSLSPGNRSAPWDPKALAAALEGRWIFSEIVGSDFTGEEEPYRILSRPFPNYGPVQAVIQAPYPLGEVNRTMSGLNHALLALIPVGLLCAGMVGALLTDRMLRRVYHLTRAAEQIGARDFSERLPVSGNDEFSQLADTFNGLLGRLEGAYKQQERLLEQQRRFTADASHELKTPLTIIKGTTSMALSRPPREDNSIDKDYRYSMREIDHAAGAMSGLVQDLLLLARSDGGQLGKDRIELLVREIIERALSGIAREQRKFIDLKVENDSLTVLGNETELVRLFSNLLDNAVKYNRENGRITITLSHEVVHEDSRGKEVSRDKVENKEEYKEEKYAKVEIADSGIGIPSEHLLHLGERFYRVDSSRSRPSGGTGLGLSICKGIVEAHHGTLHFESEVNVGTTVTVVLPAINT